MKIGVIMGGTSSERQISLYTGEEIMNNLNKDKYEVLPVLINQKKDLINGAAGLDFAFLALHGGFGEDGTAQAVLDALGIPYSGSGMLSSALCMDKNISKLLVKAKDIKTADWILVRKLNEIKEDDLEALGYPLVVKPNSGGSSVYTFIVENYNQLIASVSEVLKTDDQVMIEQYIAGDEITCSILGDKVLPILSIKPNAEFFDYSSKYEDGGAEEVVAELDENLQQNVEDLALQCYKLHQCSVYARVDMIIKEGIPYFLEVNTLPGMTKNSLLPKSAKAAGIEFPQLLDLIIGLTRGRFLC